MGFSLHHRTERSVRIDCTDRSVICQGAGSSDREVEVLRARASVPPRAARRRMAAAGGKLDVSNAEEPSKDGRTWARMGPLTRRRLVVRAMQLGMGALA